MTREELEQIEDVAVLEEERDKLIKARVDNNAEIKRLEFESYEIKTVIEKEWERTRKAREELKRPKIRIDDLKDLNLYASPLLPYLQDRIRRKGKHRCHTRYYPTVDPSNNQCRRTAKVCRNGVWYCGIHDPERGKK